MSRSFQTDLVKNSWGCLRAVLFRILESGHRDHILDINLHCYVELSYLLDLILLVSYCVTHMPLKHISKICLVYHNIVKYVLGFP